MRGAAYRLNVGNEASREGKQKQKQKQKSARERLAALPLGSGLTKNHFMKEQIFKNTLAKDIKPHTILKTKKLPSRFVPGGCMALVTAVSLIPWLIQF